jgi:hypothetical protein
MGAEADARPQARVRMRTEAPHDARPQARVRMRTEAPHDAHAQARVRMHTEAAHDAHAQARVRMRTEAVRDADPELHADREAHPHPLDLDHDLVAEGVRSPHLHDLGGLDVVHHEHAHSHHVGARAADPPDRCG